MSSIGWIRSVGIDIGTTTSHLIVSELELTLVGEPGQVPRPGLGERKIVHRGAVRFTPLRAGPDGAEIIDPDGVAAVIREEYAAAGLRPEQIASGAVLITGESARRANAEEVAGRVADLAGRFVAAAAGPNLEGILAGRGSGAAEHSRRFSQRVLNIDIGGGTANFAWFDRGRVVDAACLRVGARHLRFDAAGAAAAATEVGLWAASLAGVRLQPGQLLSPTERAAVAEQLALYLLSAVAGDWPTLVDGPLLVNAPARAETPVEPVDTVMFSGGVAELMRAPNTPGDWGDLGRELAAALLARAPTASAVGQPSWAYPAEPIRATVIGAGLHAAQISGDTVWVPEAADAGTRPRPLLPVQNVPVLRPFGRVGDLLSAERALMGLRTAAAQQDCDWSAGPTAWALPSLLSLELTELRTVAGVLADAAAAVGAVEPLILLLSDDLGHTMGRLVTERLTANPTGPRVVLAVDELVGEGADFVDIGSAQPSPAGERVVLPVVLKTLAFG